MITTRRKRIVSLPEVASIPNITLPLPPFPHYFTFPNHVRLQPQETAEPHVPCKLN